MGLYGFTLEGFNFEGIPGDAVGILALNNDDPLQRRESQDRWAYMPLVSKTENTLVFRFEEQHQFSVPNYLGGIVSADRSEVYWINETRPLP